VQGLSCWNAFSFAPNGLLHFFEGAANAGEMLAAARERFDGACLMPPFDHYEVLSDILKENG
jgi:hypothetical protein